MGDGSASHVATTSAATRSPPVTGITANRLTVAVMPVRRLEPPRTGRSGANGVPGRPSRRGRASRNWPEVARGGNGGDHASRPWAAVADQPGPVDPGRCVLAKHSASPLDEDVGPTGAHTPALVQPQPHRVRPGQDVQHDRRIIKLQRGLCTTLLLNPTIPCPGRAGVGKSHQVLDSGFCKRGVLVTGDSALTGQIVGLIDKDVTAAPGELHAHMVARCRQQFDPNGVTRSALPLPDHR